MRIGENPTKFARHNPDIVRLDIKKPENILACTVVYIPRLDDYYAEALDVLKASLYSLCATVDRPFDLLVYDNGSCSEVQDFLRKLHREDIIQWLWLSSCNMKKIGAWSQIFGAAQADLVYFFDCDIFHRAGWLEDCLAVLDAYPEAGIVNAAPLPMKGAALQAATLSTSIDIAHRTRDIHVEQGQFTNPDWFREFGESLGSQPDTYLAQALANPQVRVTRNNVSAYIQSWHAQFLARRNVLQGFFPADRTWHTEGSDRSFDEYLNSTEIMRLGIVEPLVIHLGNTIHPRYREEVAQLLGEHATKPRLVPRCKPWFMRIPGMPRVVRRLHALTFEALYNVKCS